MESEYVIDEQATIKGADIEEVYDTCLSWLNKHEAIIQEQRRPHFIKAEHGHGRGIIYQDHGKYFIIELLQQEDKVIIRFKIPPLEWSPPEKSPLYPMYWIEFVEDLWRCLGVQIDEKLLRHLYPSKKLNKIISRNTRDFIILTMVFGMSAIFILLNMFWFKSTPINIKIIFIVLWAVSIVCWFKFVLPLLSEAKMLRKRLCDLYPDK